MACTTCGTNVPCGCSSTSSSSSGSNAGCCTPVVPSSPQPYYACAPSCEENNKQRIILQSFATDVNIENSWNVPECGENAVLTIPGLTSALPGSYIWNSAYGYFEVISVDIGRQQVTVANNCNEGNAAVGTQVPACTKFIVIDPPADTPDLSNVCVEIDFTAPDVGDCIDITLNSVSGIASSDIVQIGTGFYRVSEVKPNDIITICNDGDGLVPGTPVIAKDANDNYNYCLTIISTNPCENPVVNQGAILVCKDGKQQPLNTDGLGYVPQVVDIESNDAQYAPLATYRPMVCATLTDPINITTGTVLYTLVVDSTTGFNAYDIIEVGGTPFYRFTIITVVDATHLDVSIFPVPGADLVIPAGAEHGLCLIGCCEQNAVDIQRNYSVSASWAYSSYTAFTYDLSGYASFILTPITTITTPDDGYNYLVSAQSYYITNAIIQSVGLPDFNIVQPIYHEVQTVWDSLNYPEVNPTSNIRGRDSWIDWGIFGICDEEAAIFPGAFYVGDDRDWSILPPPEPEQCIQHYRAHEMRTVAYEVPPNTTLTLTIRYRNWVPWRNETAYTSSIGISMRGFVEMTRGEAV